MLPAAAIVPLQRLNHMITLFNPASDKNRVTTGSPASSISRTSFLAGHQLPLAVLIGAGNILRQNRRSRRCVFRHLGRVSFVIDIAAADERQPFQSFSQFGWQWLG